MRAVLAVFAALVLLAPGARAQDLADHVAVQRPEGADGPVPAVLLFAGCGGVRQVQDMYAEAALEAGWAAVIVDSFKARGIGRLGARLTVCTGLRLRGTERADDVFAALEIVRGRPGIDPDRLALAGWSHGGWTILDAMSLAESGARPALSGVREAFLIYPYCGFLTRADSRPIGGIPVTMTVAGRDRVVSAEACRKLVEDRRADGAAITWIYEPELTHAFDAPDQAADPRMRYDPEGAARSLNRFREALIEAGGRTPG